VLARALVEAGRAAEAVAAAERALALEPANSAAHAARAEAVAVLEATEPSLAALELTAALKPDGPAAHLDLGQAYAELDRPADAERCFKRALSLAPDLDAAHAALGALYLSVGILDGAEHHARRALALKPGQAVASQTLASLLERRGDTAGALALLDAAYARQSLFVEPARDSRMTVLVLATQSDGNIPYRHLMPPNLYARLIWYMEHASEDQIAALPPHDLVFNTIGDPDLATPSRAAVGRFLERSDRPWLNDPARIALTTRDNVQTLLGDLEDVVVPEAVRIAAASIARLGLDQAVALAGLMVPVLVRPIGSHGGRGLARADSDEALEAMAPGDEAEDLYVTQYRDYAAADGRYRKGRMIFVDRRPYPYHWAISDHWLVHYESAGMGGKAERQAEERAFLSDPARLIGERAMAAVTRIGERLDLDYCGLDFSVLPDGRVLVFEANATMFVHPEPADGELAYKNAAVKRITDAFQAHLAHRVAAAPGRAA
jgi:Flp pilus assembly protein TadD/glutathione synthase/RimK-type ligase-like ATP-grasp enzyme